MSAFGTADFDAFKRKAIVLKTIAVAALALVYLRFPLDPASLAVIAGGIFLNARAAAVLGLETDVVLDSLAFEGIRRTFPALKTTG